MIVAVAPAILPATRAATQPAPATPPISAAQFKKINGYIADKGRDIPISKAVSDAFGLTKNNEIITARALTVRERDSGIVHQIQTLPEGKGYLVGNIGPVTMDVYWADKNLVLLSSIGSVQGMLSTAMPPGMLTAAVPVAEAQAGFDKELAYWAGVADTL